jgi:hypothetical protein
MATQVRSTWLTTDAQEMADLGIVNAEEGGYNIGAIVMDERFVGAHLSAHLNAYDNSAFSAENGVPDDGAVEFEMASTYTW